MILCLSDQSRGQRHNITANSQQNPHIWPNGQQDHLTQWSTRPYLMSDWIIWYPSFDLLHKILSLLNWFHVWQGQGTYAQSPHRTEDDYAMHGGDMSIVDLQDQILVGDIDGCFIWLWWMLSTVRWREEMITVKWTLQTEQCRADNRPDFQCLYNSMYASELMCTLTRRWAGTRPVQRAHIHTQSI